MELLRDIPTEVHQVVLQGVHPTVSALVEAFLGHLREPRYHSPLLYAQLASLFGAFYTHLNSLVVHIYTQLNTNKRLLLAQSQLFHSDPRTFDYLLAIASYLPLLLKLVRRTDPQAAFQLRVFAYYKFLMIMDTIEKAQYDLFCSTGIGEKSMLYDKIYRFHSRDSAVQRLLTQKLRLLCQLSLPFSCFCESTSDTLLNEFFLTLALDPALPDLKKTLECVSLARTPSAKLKHMVKVQKRLIQLLASHTHGDVLNDLLLPALIYIIVHHVDPELELHLNLTFVKAFLNTIDASAVDASAFTLQLPLAGYNPTDKRRPRNERKLSTNLYDLLNLTLDTEPLPEAPKGLRSDADLLLHLQSNFLNNGELEFYLTNFEAIVYFLLNTTISELAPSDFVVPAALADNELLTKPLYEIVDQQEAGERPSDAELEKRISEELHPNRLRLGLLFNTISSAVQNVGRLRLNLGIKSPFGREPSGFEALIYSMPMALTDKVDHYGLGRVKDILGRLGLVSSIQFKPLEEEYSEEDTDTRAKRLASILDKISPNLLHPRSESLDFPGVSPTPHARKALLTLKFSNGVLEFMTRIANTNAQAFTVPTQPPSSASNSTAKTLPSVHASNTSLHSLDETSPFEDDKKLHQRLLSMQTVDRWFHNIASERKASPREDACALVFSASFAELTKFQNTDFESLTVKDLKTLKSYYDQLCTEIMLSKTGSKTSNEYLPEIKDDMA